MSPFADVNDIDESKADIITQEASKKMVVNRVDSQLVYRERKFMPRPNLHDFGSLDDLGKLEPKKDFK